MYALFNLFLDICLFRKGPQDVPASLVLLRLTLITYGLSGFFVLLLSVDLLTAGLMVLIDVGLLSALTYGMLNLWNYRIRFIQTLTALLGTGTLLQLLILPVSIWMAQELTAARAPEFPWLLSLGLIGWSIAVIAHILHHALSISRSLGLLYTLGYVILSWTISGWLYPVN
jgi:hypothetical protein